MSLKITARSICATALLISFSPTAVSHAQTLTLGGALQRALAANPRWITATSIPACPAATRASRFPNNSNNC
jgi:hypothetical protein